MHGVLVTFTDTVAASTGTPTGTGDLLQLARRTPWTKTSLGTGRCSGNPGDLGLPVGTTYVEAVYAGSGNYGGSTSNVVSQVVLNVPSACAAGGYNDVINGTWANPFVYGTNGNDLIFAFGSSFWINGFAGNDCIDAGDGNNVIFDGNGNDSVVAGNGWNTVILGNGNDKVSLGNGSDGVQAGDGNDTVTVGNGSQSEIIVGNGNDTVTVGSGSSNQIELGRGTDTVTIQSPGSHDLIDGGNGNETIYLGSGSYNTYNGQAHHTNVCHLPKPPCLLARHRSCLLPRHPHQLLGGLAMTQPRHRRSSRLTTSFRRGAVLLVGIVGSLALAGVAWAYFTSTGTGAGSALVGHRDRDAHLNDPHVFVRVRRYARHLRRHRI